MSNTFEFAERFGLSFPFSNTITETPSFFQTGFSFLNKLVDKFNQGSFILRDYQILTTPISKIEAKGKVLREYLLEHKKSKPKGYHLLYQVYEKGKPNYKSNGESYYLNTIVSTRKDQKIRKENYELSYNISDDYKRYNFRVLFPFDSYEDNSTRLSDKYGVIIETRNFDAFYTFLLDLGLDLKEDFLNSISSDFEKALDSDSDEKRLKELYEDAPAFVINQIDDDKLFQHFMTLTKYDDKGWLRDFKDASSSLLKVLQGIKNAEFIYAKFNQNQELVTRVYHNLDGTTNFNGYVMPNKTLFTSILSGICTEIGQKNTNNLCYSGVTFQKDKIHKIETNGGKTHGDEMLIRQYKGRTVTTTKVIGGGDSPQHNQRFTFEDVAFDEGTNFNLRPLDIVNFIMDGQDRPVALPAIFVFDVAFQEKWEDINRIIRIGIDVLVIIGSIVVIISNPGTLLLALSWAELGISGADILIVTAEEELKKTSEGREFLRLWNTVYVIGGAITGGPLILISGARLLRVVSQKTRKFLLASMVRVILEIKITNFVGSTIKVIDYAEVVKVGGNTLATIQKTTRMQKAGVVFVKGINEADKVEGLVVIYKGTTIAQGSAKVVRTTLDDVFKTTSKGKLFDALQEVLDNVKIPFINGFSLEKVLKIQKGKRPRPNTYIEGSYILRHLKKFEKGVSYIVKKSTLDTYGRNILGMPDNTQFVMIKSQMDDLLKKADGNITSIEKELGIPDKLWHGEELVRIDVKTSTNLRMPDGNEMGANELWLPGGKLPTGYLEAVIDNIKKGNYIETKIELK